MSVYSSFIFTDPALSFHCMYIGERARWEEKSQIVMNQWPLLVMWREAYGI